MTKRQDREAEVARLTDEVRAHYGSSASIRRIIRDALAAARREGAAEARARKHCGCGWCCGSMPPDESKVPRVRGEGHWNCSAGKDSSL